MKGTKRNTPCPFCGGRKQRYSERCNKCSGALRVATGMCHTNLSHGHSGDRKMTPEYAAWHAMRQRCHNPKNPYYGGYGARGISVAPEWHGDFMAFFAHVGPKPSQAHSLDRINNNGNYEPGNVRWATRAEQSLNRRVCLGILKVDKDGNEESISLLQAASILAISYSALRTHLVRAGVLQPEPRQFIKKRRAA